MSEEILGIFPGFIQDGKGERGYLKFKGRMCKMVFTNNRLIITEDKRTGGNTLFRPQPYSLDSVALNDVINSSSDNIQISYATINKIVTHKPFIENWLFRIYTSDTNTPDYTITICPPGIVHAKYLKTFNAFLRQLSPTKTMYLTDPK